ncbi:MAG: hypothetical protein SAJ12_02845 [Jaaginema sp. PMC 1079.18]|nr:hypothetical protein [Jaaginema sp. PMC 1080.18]MEC4849924.1 hypothetical protein [Jaaginema sp. PMC 1079.18]MEC4864896.1 hypothetical protein [Jaaginema sp. PMC 1078.18]
MKRLSLGCISAIALVSAIACTPVPSVTSATPSVSQEPQSTQPYTTDFFTVDLPVGWTAQVSGSEYYILWNEPPPGPREGIAPANVIKTDVTLIDQNFETAIAPEFLSDTGEVLQRNPTQINGRDAVQVYTHGGYGDFPDTWVTIMRYSEERSVMMSSYFTASHESSLTMVKQLHESLTVK